MFILCSVKDLDMESSACRSLLALSGITVNNLAIWNTRGRNPYNI